MILGFRILALLLCPGWFNRQQPVADHTRSPRYQAKKRIVKGIWIASGLMMLAYPLLPFIVTLGLFTTFLSFTILDESG